MPDRQCLRLAIALLALCTSPAFAAPPPELDLLLGARNQAAAAAPAHAVAGTLVEGRLNAAALKASRVRLELPSGRRLFAERQVETLGNRGEQSWVGEFEGQPGSLLAVTTHRGAVSGFLHHGSEVWELATATDGTIVLFQVDEALLPDEHEPIRVEADMDDPAAHPAAYDTTAASDASPVVQDLLFVYTGKSVQTAGGVASLESKIINAVAAANAGYRNSGVAISLNLVGMVQTPYVETGDMTLSLSRLRNTSDGHMDEVHALRDSLGADLVTLLSEDTGYCGIAYVMASPGPGFASAAFSVTKQSCFSNQTLAHEIGHNQGNSHDRKNGGSSAYPYSFGYRTCDNVAPTGGQSFRTIMAYSCTGSRVNYFSNPNVYYNGAQMGVAYEADPANSADNARSMNNTASITAAFRSTSGGTVPAAPSQLNGIAPDADRVQLGWQDNSGDETGFTLQRAVNGDAFTDRATLAANTVGFSDTGLSGGTTYSYRVRAWNSTGASTFSNVLTTITPDAAPTPPPPDLPAVPSPASVVPESSGASVTWTEVASAGGYEIRRESLNSKNGRWTTTTMSVAAGITSLSESLQGGTYRYAARALNVAGASQWAVAGCSSCASDGSFTIISSKRGGKGGGNPKDSSG